MTAIVITASPDPSWVRPLGRAAQPRGSARRRGLARRGRLRRRAADDGRRRAPAPARPAPSATPSPSTSSPAVRDRPAPAARGGPRPMTTPTRDPPMPTRASVRLRRPEEGWTASSWSWSSASILAWAIDDPAGSTAAAALTDCLPLCAMLGVAVGLRRAEGRLGPLDDAPGRRRCSRRCSSRSSPAGGRARRRRSREAFRVTADGHGRRLPRPRLARPGAHGPGGPLHPRARAARVGDDAVRRVRRLRPPAAARRRRHRRARAAREHGAHQPRPAARTSSRSPSPRCSC